MNVVIVTQSYHPRPGGVTEHVHHTALELKRLGHEVTIVTSRFDAGCECEPRVVRLGRNVLVPANGAWVNVTVGIDLYGQLRRVLHDLAPDVVHTHCPLAPTLPLLALLAAPRRCRIVGTFHAAAGQMSAYHFFRPVLGRMIRRLDARIAVSEAARKLAAQYYPGTYTVIPNGVDCNRFRPDCEPIARFRDGAFNVLFVGRMDKRKGLKYLFHAMSLIRPPVDRRLRLIVVGDDGPRRHLLPRLPADIELVFTGVVPDEELPRYFASGDVFCSPAVERESFGIVLLEAMASGIPVIGTNIPGYLTILRDRWNSLVVPPRTPRALATAIERLLADEPLRWKLRQNGRKFAGHYHWRRIVAQIESIYEGRDVEARPLPALEAVATESSLRAQKA